MQNEIYFQHGLEKEVNTSSQQDELEMENRVKRTKEKRKHRLLKKKTKLYSHMSYRYTVYLISFWLIFIASFIMGFVVHYDIPNTVNISTILWCFSAILFIISTLYSLVFYKAKQAKTKEELTKYLKYIPI